MGLRPKPPAAPSRGPQRPTPGPRGAPCAPSLLRLSMRRVPTAPATVLLHLESITYMGLRPKPPAAPSRGPQRPTPGPRRAPRALAKPHAGRLAWRFPTWGCAPITRGPFAAYSMISVIVPEPTVRPPSRIANRKPFSSATGVISSTLIATLSPGITISTPSGRLATPVTSVVRR